MLGGIRSDDTDIDRRLSLTSPGGHSAYYAWDPAGRMQHAQSSEASLGTAYYSYDANGNVTKKVLGNGCFTYFSYDALGRAASIQNCLPDGSPLVYFAYDYDPAGRITKCGREDASVVYYGYDDADRLASFTWKDSGGSTLYAFAWDYDAVGNRVHEGRNGVHTYYEYDAGNELIRYRELPADEWTYFAYDPRGRGNTTRIHEPDGTTYFEYTDADLIQTIKYKTGVVNYFYYDARLRRYAMVDSSGLTYFTWDRNGMNLLCERDADGNVTADYTHGYTPVDGIGSAVGAKKLAGGATYYQFDAYDHRGTKHRQTDQNGNVTAYYEYDPWGVPLRADEVGPNTPTRFRYQSNWIQLKDSSHNLFLSPTRLYDPKCARFLQRDGSYGLAGGYVYCSDNAVGRADSNGTQDGPADNAFNPLSDMFSRLGSIAPQPLRDVAEDLGQQLALPPGPRPALPWEEPTGVVTTDEVLGPVRTLLQRGSWVVTHPSEALAKGLKIPVGMVQRILASIKDLFRESLPTGGRCSWNRVVRASSSEWAKAISRERCCYVDWHSIDELAHLIGLDPNEFTAWMHPAELLDFVATMTGAADSRLLRWAGIRTWPRSDDKQHTVIQVPNVFVISRPTRFWSDPAGVGTWFGAELPPLNFMWPGRGWATWKNFKVQYVSDLNTLPAELGKRAVLGWANFSHGDPLGNLSGQPRTNTVNIASLERAVSRNHKLAYVYDYACFSGFAGTYEAWIWTKTSRWGAGAVLAGRPYVSQNLALHKNMLSSYHVGFDVQRGVNVGLFNVYPRSLTAGLPPDAAGRKRWVELQLLSATRYCLHFRSPVESGRPLSPAIYFVSRVVYGY